MSIETIKTTVLRPTGNPAAQENSIIQGVKEAAVGFIKDAHAMDKVVGDYLKGKADIVDLTPQAAMFVTQFEASKNLVEAAIKIPQTLLNVQV